MWRTIPLTFDSSKPWEIIRIVTKHIRKDYYILNIKLKELIL
jgi:hypothetical protein